MDNTKTITHLGLCAGYGGIELGLKRVLPALRTVALCEIEAFAIANLVAKMEARLMDAAPIWTDLKTFPWAEFSGRVDILTGGYPCQPFSAAGKRLGSEDPRHLWPYIANGIRLLRPRICFFENVEGHITLGLPSVVSDLEELGYRVSWGIFSAAEVGAPHQRKRVFILAESIQQGLEGHAWDGAGSGEPGWIIQKASRSIGAGRVCGWPSRPGESQHAWEPPRVVGNAEHNGCSSSEIPGSTCQKQEEWGMQELGGGCGLQIGNMGNAESGVRLRRASGDERHAAQPDETSSHGQTESSLGGNAYGPAGGLDHAELYVSCDNRIDELRLLGNGVVPTVAGIAFCDLFDRTTKLKK